MIRVLMSPDGRRVVINDETDPCLYKAPCQPPQTGNKYVRGEDLFYHKARSGNEYFYIHYWSIVDGEEDNFGFKLITREEAEQFLLDKAGKCGWEGLEERDFERLKRYGFDLLYENA